EKMFEGSVEAELGLAEVNELARARADDVDAQMRVGVELEDELQQAGAIADDLPAGNLAVVRLADLVRHAGVGQLLLGAADHRDFRNRIDAVREQRWHTPGLDAERVAGGNAALLHRPRRQAGKADDVANGVYMRHRRLVMVVDGD